MKRLTTKIVAGSLLLFCFKVFATDRNDFDINVGAKALAGAASYSQGGAGGASTLNNSYSNQAPDYGDLRIVPPAIAPSINTGVICPMVMQGSKAGSVFFFSGSGTHAPDIVPICVAWHLGQKDVVERMTCASSKEYAKANPNCGR